MHALRLTRRAAMAARVPFRPNSYRVLMRVHVVSDVHGSTDALARAGEDADALFCLGDLILFVDYADNSQGIFADLFGAEQARKFIALRTARRFDEARALSARLWAGLPGDPAKHVEAAVSRQYAELFAALPEPAYLTYGNVDIPGMWRKHLRPRHTVLDGERIELDGWTFGFVGGGLHSPYRTPNEICSVWPCASASGEPRADRHDRMHQRRSFPRHADSVRSRVVAVRSVQDSGAVARSGWWRGVAEDGRRR